MKNSSNIFLLLLLFSFLVSENVCINASAANEQSNESIKILTYNIEESGSNANWKEVIKEENPDIMVLVETGDWDDDTKDGFGSSDFIDLVTDLNSYFPNENPYEAYTTQNVPYDTSGEAILSRYEIIEFKQIGILPLDDATNYDVTHDFFDAILNVEQTIMHIIGCHLKASSGETNEWRRERETEGIINYMDSLGENVPIMYMGDLNSFSPDDTGVLAPEGDLGYGPLTMMLHPENITYSQYASENHTFTDIFRTLNPLDPGYSYGHQNPIYTSRIDFILANSFFDVLLINSTVGDTPSADVGSDHYSVDVNIQFNSETTTETTTEIFTTSLTSNSTISTETKTEISSTTVTSNSTPYFLLFQLIAIFVLVMKKKG